MNYERTIEKIQGEVATFLYQVILFMNDIIIP